MPHDHISPPHDRINEVQAGKLSTPYTLKCSDLCWFCEGFREWQVSSQIQVKGVD